MYFFTTTKNIFLCFARLKLKLIKNVQIKPIKTPSSLLINIYIYLYKKLKFIIKTVQKLKTHSLLTKLNPTKMKTN